jgi:hypothetical protein
VASLRAASGDREAAGLTWRLAGLALRHLRAGAVTLVLVGGLPGTGKSALAGTLADRLGFTVLRSDRIRKELAGISPRQRCAVPWGTGIYTAAWTERTYAELADRARRLLVLGESVIVDATFTGPAGLAACSAAAAAAHADLVQLRCTAPAEVAARRLTARTGDISDASETVARHMAASAIPWPEAVTIDTGLRGPDGEPGAAAIESAMAAIRPRGPDRVWHPARPVVLPG